MMPGPEFENPKGPIRGRLVLLFGAYAPVALIVGLRGLPDCAAWAVVTAGVLGIGIWIAFLRWLPDRQRQTSRFENAEFVDSEVTGYIVSILLPVVAASKPELTDWLAYAVCAILILTVAYAAELWSVNPITYAFGMRAARATVDGTREIVLIRGQLADDGLVTVVQRLGVTLILGPANDKEPSK